MRQLRYAPLLLLFLSVLLPVAACHRTSPQEEWPTGGGSGPTVDEGDPALPAQVGYAGSEVCAGCHRDVFDTWSGTFHSLSVRMTDKPGATGQAMVCDSNGNGTNDFQDGLDLSTVPTFSRFGANAPELRFVAGDDYPYKVVIGPLTLDVWRTLGGNGPWRQRYLTQVGDGVFVLPIQYNEQSAGWVPYDPDTWYDAAGAPRFTTPAQLDADIDPAVAFDLNCAGCHSTGLTVEFSAADNRYLNGYIELNIGCEMCHGPGAAHAQSGGSKSLILNPDDLLNGTADGVVAADLTCGQCHIRGFGGIPVHGSDPTGYPWNGTTTFPVGQTGLSPYYEPTTDPVDFWLYKDNPMGFAPTPSDASDDTYVAAREAEMHYLEKSTGAHAPVAGFSPTCFNCHDPHFLAQEYQIRRVVVRGGTTYTNVSVDDNSLCLTCHQGFGDFSAVTPSDVDAVTKGQQPGSVVSAVVDHMADNAAMSIADAAYDPGGGLGTGRCTLCHMVETATSATATQDKAGNLVGDLHSHKFQPVWPNVSKLTTPAVTNSCNVCHPLFGGDSTALIIEEWAVDPDGDGTYHADTPRNFQNGVANPERNGGVACVACHTTEGFVEIQVVQNDIHFLSDPADAGVRTDIVYQAISRAEGVTCRACHGKNSTGNFAPGQNPLRIPKQTLCGSCHNNETVVYDDYRDHGEILRHPQREMFAGTFGAQVPGETYGNSAHTPLANPDCTACHYRAGTATKRHTFEPTIEACNVCHPTLATFNRQAFADHDDDGVVEGIQDEIDGSLELLKDAILATPTSTGALITYAAPYFLIDGSNSDTAALNPVADAPLVRGMFNSYYVDFDASRGIHNTTYALQLIQRSYEEITGDEWPGAIR